MRARHSSCGIPSPPTPPLGNCAHSASIRTEAHWTGSAEELTIEHANLSHVWFRAVRSEWTPGKDTLTRDPQPADLLELEKLLVSEAALAWDVALPDAKDCRVRHTSALAPEHLAPGYYLMVASASEDFSPVDNPLSYLIQRPKRTPQRHSASARRTSRGLCPPRNRAR